MCIANFRMLSKYLLAWLIILQVEGLQEKSATQKSLRFQHLTKCTYDYEVTVYTARGDKSTHTEGYQVHALVRFILIQVNGL